MQPESNETKQGEGKSLKEKAKLGAVIVSIVIVGLLVLQNRAPVTTRILWAEVEMPRIMLLLMMLAIGFVLGAVYGSSSFTRKGRERSKT